MTTSRVVRGSKGRIFLYISAVLIITGIIACYNSTLTQLDEIRKAKDQCHQQQENLSTQLQVIFDYKQRLEKSLKTEKAEHQQIKADLENKLSEEKIRNEKLLKDDDLKLSALQQHYKLLETQHKDFQEECSNSKKEQLDHINDLQRKLQEVQSAFEQLKNKYMQLKVEKENLENQIQDNKKDHYQQESERNHLLKENHQLQREIDELKSKCNTVESEKAGKHPVVSNTNFSKQIEREGSIFEIPKSEKLNDHNTVQIPKDNKPSFETINNNNVLAVPGNDEQLQKIQVKSSTKASDLKSKEISKASINGILPLLMPTVTPNSTSKSSAGPSNKIEANVLPAPNIPKLPEELPEGVVPFSNHVLENPYQEKSENVDDKNAVGEAIKDTFPNRYRSNIIENDNLNENNVIQDSKQDQLKELRKSLGDLKDDDKAVEVDDNKVQGEPLFGENEKNEKPEFQHIMHIKPKYEDPFDYGKNGHDAAMEEEEEDDDGEDDGGIPHQKEPAVRN